MLQRPVLLSLTLLLCPSIARAAETDRYAVVVEERCGSQACAAGTENELLRLLSERGYRFVDEAQARKIRSVTDVGRLLESGVSPVITTLDADALIVGVSTLSAIKSAILGDKVHRAAATLALRLIAVDTAEVLGAYNVRGAGLGYDEVQAQQEAAKQAVRAAVEQIATTPPRQRTQYNYQIEVSGLSDLGSSERVLAALGRSPAVSRLTVLHASRELTKLAVESPVNSARSLARLLATLPDSGLVVYGYTNAVIRAEFQAVQGTAATARGQRKPLEVLELTADNVFPSRMVAYADQPLGRLKAKNRSPRLLRNLAVSVELVGFMSSPVSSGGLELAPGATLDLPLKVVLDRDRLVAHDENSPAVLQVLVEYDDGDLRVQHARELSVVVHDRNAFDWRVPQAIAAFVTPHSAEVQRLARAWTGAALDAHLLAGPVALFEGLAMTKLRYIADPMNAIGGTSLDYVQFPEQTLAGGGGDCDDLSVLYAALAEAVGLPSLIVTTPGHVLAAVSIGLPPQSARSLARDPSAFLTFRGQLYVPVETTKLGGSFEEAWEAGAKELSRWRGEPRKISVVDLREAWRRFPPANLSSSASPLPLESPALAVRVRDALRRLEAARAEALAAERRTLDAALAQPALEKAERRRLKGQQALLFLDEGDLERAREQFERLLLEDGRAPSVLNDLANLLLLQGDTGRARALYQRALTLSKEPKATVRIRLNAALAAFIEKDERAFGALIVSCLEAGAEEAVLSLATAGFSAPTDTRGAGPSSLEVRDLELALGRVLQASGRRGLGAETRSSRGEARPVGRFLYWLARP